MLEKLIPQLDQHGYMVGEVIADPSPLEHGVFLIPAGAIDVPLPVVPDGKRARWNGSGFDIEVVSECIPDLGLSSEEMEAISAAKADQERARVVGEIAALEAQQARPVREIIAAMATGDVPPSFAIKKLEALNTQIAELRSGL